MKHHSIFLTALVALCLVACSSLALEDKSLIGSDDDPEQYFLNSVLRAERIQVKLSKQTDDNYLVYRLSPAHQAHMQGKLLAVSLGGTDLYRDRDSYTSPNRAEFRRLADSIGDGNYYRPKAFSTDGGAYKHTISSGIKSISLKALSVYNATHPAGSDLGDMTHVCWMEILKRAKRDAVVGEMLQRIWEKYGRQVRPPFDDFARQPQISLLADLAPIHIPALMSEGSSEELLCYLSLNQEPSTAVQELELSITLMNGQVLRTTFSVDFAQ